MVFRFLLVSLAIDTILEEVTVLEKKRKLDEMTKGNHLGDVYKTTLERIKAQKGGRSRLGISALMWISNSERPLRTSELCHALGVRIGSTDLDVEGVPTIRTLIGCSLGLITVEASSSVVRLVHFTLQEYLSSNPSLFQSPHSMIAEVCLTYLNFRCVRELSPTLLSAPPIVPFVGYASCYWGRHMGKEKTESATQLALLLLVRYEEHVASRLLLLHYYKYGCWDNPNDKRFMPQGFTGLHGAAFHGIGEIVPALSATKEWSINERDNNGRTALLWAAIRGHEDVVKQLLELKNIDPKAEDTEYSLTPLWWAVEGRHEGVVRMLLERKEVNPNTPNTEYGQTPLLWAARRRYEGIARMLLEREEINPNIADTLWGRTPLWWAAERGHGGIVRMLLEQEDINPNIGDTLYDRTPLWWAPERGHEGIVRMLLERERIDTNLVDTSWGQTLLWWAAQRGYERVARMLLERVDINPNTTDTECGRTPLQWAAECGHVGIVKLLLQRGDIDLNTPDTGSGQTPLLQVAQHGCEGIVRMLLEREDLNPDTPGPSSGTALNLAASHEHAGIVQLPSQPWPHPIPIDIGKATNIGRNTLPQGNLLSNSKKRTTHPSDGEEQRKKYRGAPI